MAPRLKLPKLPFRGGEHENDPYWDFFINQQAADPRNAAVEIMRNAPEGAVFPTKSDLHSPEITTEHLKELAYYVRAERVGVVRLDGFEPEISQGYPFAVICLVPAKYNPRRALGFGGQVAVQNGLFITFVLSAYMRELGYRATAEANDPAADRLAAAAGLGKLNANGRLVTPHRGVRVHVADPIRTDLPLVADG